jgi:hypothetical protein
VRRATVHPVFVAAALALGACAGASTTSGSSPDEPVADDEQRGAASDEQPVAVAPTPNDTIAPEGLGALDGAPQSTAGGPEELRGTVYRVSREPCPTCVTGFRFAPEPRDGRTFVDMELVVPAQHRAAVRRCANVGAPMHAVVRVDGDPPGSCGEGCRRYQLERLVTPCPRPTRETIAFHEGVYSQCLGSTAAHAACMRRGPECRYHANVPHPCSNSGARCVPERERARGPATRPCQCICPPPPGADRGVGAGRPRPPPANPPSARPRPQPVP